MKNSWILILLTWVYCTSCDHAIQTDSAKKATVAPNTPATDPASGIFANTSNSLDAYWYQGKAELNVYELEQNRYQGIHPGEVLLIFVTEDFLTDKQVKNDNYQNDHSTPVLKTNAISRFTTGLYDYSMMTSVFTPVKTADYSRTLKVTNSSQDWCGQSLSQINLVGNDYRHRLFSYFESEGDQDKTIKADMLEDEIWNRVRQLGVDLPTGELAIIPSMNFLRLRHQNYQAYLANTTMSDYQGDVFAGEQLKVYTITYPRFNRSLAIVFEAKSPFKIVGWQDTYPSAFDDQARTSTARLKNTILEKYWSMNAATEANAAARENLGW
jgi:hypothetical protein